MRGRYHVVSFGGCGSKKLVSHLKRFGVATHVHSRLPPSCLTFVDGKYNDGTRGYREWFGDNILPKSLYAKSHIILLLRHPKVAYESIYRRFSKQMNSKMNKGHFYHISVNWAMKHKLTERDDPLGLFHFATSWMNPPPDFGVIVVKHEALCTVKHTNNLYTMLNISQSSSKPIFSSIKSRSNLSLWRKTAPEHSRLIELYERLSPLSYRSNSLQCRNLCNH